MVWNSEMVKICNIANRRKKNPSVAILPSCYYLLSVKTWYDMVFRLLYPAFYANVHIEAINITWKPHTVARFSSLYFQRELLKISLYSNEFLYGWWSRTSFTFCCSSRNRGWTKSTCHWNIFLRLIFLKYIYIIKIPINI